MEGAERAAGPPTQPHRFGSGGGVGGSEFFICFTSRPSSSSMRIPSSKSLPSPGRADKYRDPAVAAAAPSLSASLSRRLKNSGSVKGGQSPAMIPAGGGSRRKSCAFEAAEPSSPKVTCIGQVKVKTARMKKKKQTLRSASKRAAPGGGGEAAFRRLEQRGAVEGDAGDLREDRECLPNRNQRWVHLPLSSICDALREFNCFLPCGGGRSLCSSSAGDEREKGEREGGVRGGNRAGEKRERGGGMGSCGAAFARWLMAVQESEGVKRGEMVELVVEEVQGRGMARELRGMEVLMDAEKGGLATKEEIEVRPGTAALVAATAAAAEDEGEAVPVCVPPPNALLLMRCRSDPVRMAALATRFWGSPAAARVEVEVEQEEEDHDEEDEVGNKDDEDADVHAAQAREEPGEAAGWGAQAAAAATIVAETSLKEGPSEMAADAESSGHCNQEAESEEVKMPPLQGEGEEEQPQLQRCQEKGERDEGSGHCAEATREMDKDSEEEEAAALEKPAVVKEHAAEEAASTEKSELLLQQEEAASAGKEVAASKTAKPTTTSSSSERQGRRPSLPSERQELKRCPSKEREGRRHSFSTEKEARRTTSSFRDRGGRRSSFSVNGDALRSSFCAEGEGRRRWSFSSEKEVRRPLAETAAEAAMVMEKKSKKKKKKKEGGEEEEEEPGAARGAGIETEARECDRPMTAAAPPVAAKEGGGEKAKREQLPDCLLLMMYEPKLSMEVSRETWVCTSDFLRFRPHHHRQQPQQAAARQGGEARAGPEDGGGGETMVVVTAGSDAGAAAASLPHPSPPPPPPPAPPAAASPTLAPALEMAKTPEKRPGSAAAGGATPLPYAAPFGLTRCKSEPMRSSAKLEPDACFWKSRHRPIGAAGIGF